MTDSAGGAAPDEQPSPPASSRWAEPDADEDGVFLAPFVPGRTAPSPAPAAEPAAEPEPAPEPAATPDEGGFPFESEPDGPPAMPAAAAPSEESSALVGDGDSSGADVADRLERLAARIRSEGADGARSAMASGDELSALLAAVVAGYMARGG